MTPRNLWYDLKDRTLIRHIPVAPMVNRTRAVDLEGDGFSELVFTEGLTGPSLSPVQPGHSSYLGSWITTAACVTPGPLTSPAMSCSTFDVTGDQVLMWVCQLFPAQVQYRLPDKRCGRPHSDAAPEFSPKSWARTKTSLSWPAYKTAALSLGSTANGLMARLFSRPAARWQRAR